MLAHDFVLRGGESRKDESNKDKDKDKNGFHDGLKVD